MAKGATLNPQFCRVVESFLLHLHIFFLCQMFNNFQKTISLTIYGFSGTFYLVSVLPLLVRAVY